MRYSFCTLHPWISKTLFATAIGLLAPCAASGEWTPQTDCEMVLQFPLEALISPVIQEIGTIHPVRDRNGAENERRGWIDRRQLPPRYPTVHRKRKPPHHPEQPEKPRRIQ